MANIGVGLAEIKFSKDPDDILICHGLGSCVGVAIFDTASRVAGMAHVLLPDSTISNSSSFHEERFADTAVPKLIRDFQEMGGNLLSSSLKIAGGAALFNTGKINSQLNVGERNIIGVKAALKKLGIRIKNEDVGGNRGRTVKLHVLDGHMTIREIGKGERPL
jgi:chemotaxis protein CheD